jgi:hypothetical protein
MRAPAAWTASHRLRQPRVRRLRRRHPAHDRGAGPRRGDLHPCPRLRPGRSPRPVDGGFIAQVIAAAEPRLVPQGHPRRHRPRRRPWASTRSRSTGPQVVPSRWQATFTSPVGKPLNPNSDSRWQRTHDVIVVKIAARAVSDHLREAESLTSASPHVCREPLIIDDRADGSPLLAPVNQWGHAPFPLSPMSPHAVSRQAWHLLDGIITVHRDLSVPPLPTSRRRPFPHER